MDLDRGEKIIGNLFERAFEFVEHIFKSAGIVFAVILLSPLWIPTWIIGFIARKLDKK